MWSGGQGRIWHSGQSDNQISSLMGMEHSLGAANWQLTTIDTMAGNALGRYLIRPSGEDKRKPASMKTPDSPEPLTTDVLMN